MSDRTMEVVITPYRDGPLLVRGPVRIQDQEGREIVVERNVVALCRCGKSRTRPLCDGTHRPAGFRAPSGLDPALRPVQRGIYQQRAAAAVPGVKKVGRPATV
jgi:CDGSH-type Zn-finger protein